MRGQVSRNMELKGDRSDRKAELMREGARAKIYTHAAVANAKENYQLVLKLEALDQ